MNGSGYSTSGMETHIAGLVLARGGSKGIPRKNIRIVAGRPLLAWVLLPMRECKRFSSVWVSTDDSEIANVATEYGAQVHFRGPLSSGDNSSSLTAVKDFLSSHKEVSVVALVQCTSPCLTTEFLEKAASLIVEGKCDSVFSVVRQHNLRWKEVGPNENTVALNFNPCARPRRQDWKGELAESGHFYFSRVSLIEEGLLQGGRCHYVEIPAEMCFEIDTDKDLVIAERLLEVYGYYKNTSSS